MFKILLTEAGRIGDGSGEWFRDEYATEDEAREMAMGLSQPGVEVAVVHGPRGPIAAYHLGEILTEYPR